MNKILPLLLFATITLAGCNYFSSSKATSEEVKVVPAVESGYRLVVREVKPGNEIVVDELELKQAALVAVIVSGVENEKIGKSELKQPGTYKNEIVKLERNLKDGEVVRLVIVDESGTEVKDNNNNLIELVMPAGMAMGHYENEY